MFFFQSPFWLTPFGSSGSTFCGSRNALVHFIVLEKLDLISSEVGKAQFWHHLELGQLGQLGSTFLEFFWPMFWDFQPSNVGF